MEDLKIGFLGTGKMGGALIEGLCENYPDLKLYLYDRMPESSGRFQDRSNVTVCRDDLEVEKSSDVVVLCVKPQDMKEALERFSGSKNYISIAAGITIESIRTVLGKDAHIARVMPNMAASIKKSVSSIYCENEKLREITQLIFSSLGSVFELKKESDMNAATALAGSGPAFVFAMVQAMAEGGVRSGLTYEASLDMTVDTFLGSAELLKETKRHPDELRNSVTSPGGTTIAGLEVLEKGGLHGLIMSAVHAAKNRSEELEKG